MSSHADRWVDYLSEKSIKGCSSCGSSSNILERFKILKIKNPIPPPPPEIRLFFPILILISKKYFQKSPILLQIKKKLLIKNSEAAYCHL